MLWLWRKETVLWEGFEGIWSPFRLESVVKFLAWGQCHHPWHTSGSLLWGTNTGWLTPKPNFRALLGSLHLCSQQSTYPQNQGLSLSLSLSWHGQHRSPSTGAGAGSQGLGSQSLHSWQHREQTKPRKTSTNVSCHQVIILLGSSFPLQQRIYSVRAAVQAGPGSLKSPILGPLRTTLSALATKLHKGFYPILLIFCLTTELKVRAALS